MQQCNLVCSTCVRIQNNAVNRGNIGMHRRKRDGTRCTTLADQGCMEGRQGGCGFMWCVVAGLCFGKSWCGVGGGVMFYMWSEWWGWRVDVGAVTHMKVLWDELRDCKEKADIVSGWTGCGVGRRGCKMNDETVGKRWGCGMDAGTVGGRVTGLVCACRRKGCRMGRQAGPGDAWRQLCNRCKTQLGTRGNNKVSGWRTWFGRREDKHEARREVLG